MRLLFYFNLIFSSFLIMPSEGLNIISWNEYIKHHAVNKLSILTFRNEIFGAKFFGSVSANTEP